VKVRRRTAGEYAEPRILGWDAAGVVQAVGDAVSLFEVGDEVYYAGDLTRPDVIASFIWWTSALLARSPASLSFEAAAAMPLTTITAWEALFDPSGCEALGDRELRPFRC